MTTAYADDRALGTGVRVVVTRPARLAAAKAAVDAVVADIDAACSRFREDSELSRLNARPDTEVALSPLLAHALEEGLRGARLTGGVVDPTVGRAMRLVGYDADFATVAREGAALTLSIEPVPGFEVVRYNAVSRTARVPRGVEIDLGATAKALAADLAAAAALEAMDGGGVLVSLGGDIAIQGEAPPGGWTVAISDNSADAPESATERVTLWTGAIASSSTRVRRWTRGGVELHHILDPRTGSPARGPWRLASTVAATCVDANIASTAAIVMGDAAAAWLEARLLPARLVGESGNVVRVAGWPRPPAAEAGR